MRIVRFLGRKFGVEEHAQLLLFLCAISNLVTFYLTRVITSGRYHYDVSLPIDHMIPCIPFAWSYLYLASFPFWAFCYIIYANQGPVHAKDLFLTDFIGKIICFIVYVTFPTQMSTPEVPIVDYWTFLQNAIWFTDQPNNLLPSIHVLVSWISWLKVRDIHGISDRLKSICFVTVVSICFAILFTRQHLVLDIPAGIAVAEFGHFISRRVYKDSKKAELIEIDKYLDRNGKIFA